MIRKETDRYFAKAMDALARFKTANDISEVDSALGSHVRSFGYDRYFFATPFLQTGDNLERRRLLLNWPREWCKQYEHENLAYHDPIRSALQTSRVSFRWSDVAVESGNAQRVMDLAAVDHRMSRGFCVPMFGLRGYEAGLSVAGQDVDDCDEAHFAIELIAVYAYNSLSQHKARPATKSLSPRQREIMRWIAAGKTTWDVSTILKISEDTVKKTAASAMRRLNAHTRAQAVAEAIRRNEFSP